jgi:hypothetical protein
MRDREREVSEREGVGGERGRVRGAERWRGRVRGRARGGRERER